MASSASVIWSAARIKSWAALSTSFIGTRSLPSLLVARLQATEQ
jgi:hypothetical protein